MGVYTMYIHMYIYMFMNKFEFINALFYCRESRTRVRLYGRRKKSNHWTNGHFARSNVSSNFHERVQRMMAPMSLPAMSAMERRENGRAKSSLWLECWTTSDEKFNRQNWPLRASRARFFSISASYLLYARQPLVSLPRWKQFAE